MTRIGTAGQQAQLDGQLSFDMMPSRLYPCTPARLGTYANCPRRYRLTYLEPVAQRRPWGHLSIGASVHTALARWWNLPRPERTPVAGAALLGSAWIDKGFRDAEQSEQLRRLAADWVTEYLRCTDPDATPIGIERTIALTTETMTVSGRVDRVDLRAEADETALVVVDYKTGPHIPTSDDAQLSLQLALYALAARRTWAKPARRVELHHLPSGTVAGFDHDAASLNEHLDRAAELAAACAGADEVYAEASSGEREALNENIFEARPSSGCQYCGVREGCAPGRAAAEGAPSWALVPQ